MALNAAHHQTQALLPDTADCMTFADGPGATVYDWTWHACDNFYNGLCEYSIRKSIALFRTISRVIIWSVCQSSVTKVQIR